MNQRCDERVTRVIGGLTLEFTSRRPRTIGIRRCIQKGGNLIKFVGDAGPGPWEGDLYDGCLFEIMPEDRAALEKIDPFDGTPFKAPELSPRDRLTSAERKTLPLARGVLDYFPDALLAVAECSRIGNEKHNPGEPLHWARGKSTDHADCIARHLLDRGKRDSDGVRHSAHLAWRALALLQEELEAEERSRKEAA